MSLTFFFAHIFQRTVIYLSLILYLFNSRAWLKFAVRVPENGSMQSSFTWLSGCSLAREPVRRRRKKKNTAFLVKGPSGAIIIRVTHSCQILVDRNESPWGNPPDALGTLHAQLTCIQFTEN